MTQASPHYLGERGRSYHAEVRGIHRFNADFALRQLRPRLSTDATFLDFGCADGALLSVVENQVKFGVEVNPESRASAVERGFTVYESTAEIDAGSIDMAVSSHVLEHTLRPLDELIGIHRVLSPTGRLMLILPLDDWRVQRKWAVPDRNHHLYAWTPRLLANLLTEAGFTVESVDVVTYTLPGRFTEQLHDALPELMFNGVARGTALVRRRRQLVAIAKP